MWSLVVEFEIVYSTVGLFIEEVCTVLIDGHKCNI